MKKFRALQAKRQSITGKNIVSIDPAKAKHQTAIMDNNGLPKMPSLTFVNSHVGYRDSETS